MFYLINQIWMTVFFVFCFCYYYFIYIFFCLHSFWTTIWSCGTNILLILEKDKLEKCIYAPLDEVLRNTIPCTDLFGEGRIRTTCVIETHTGWGCRLVLRRPQCIGLAWHIRVTIIGNRNTVSSGTWMWYIDDRGSYYAIIPSDFKLKTPSWNRI